MLWAAIVEVKLGRLHGAAAAIFEGTVHDHKYSRDELPRISTIQCAQILIESKFYLTRHEIQTSSI
jgi:hypothetical protein